VDKANVLEASRLWRRMVEEVHEARYGGGRSGGTEGPAPTLDHMLVDRAAMELVLRPTALDVVVTSNLFGDILSDAAGALAGSLGVLGSASLGGTTDLYEPVHGSAPDLAGQGVANPVGALASVALMLRHTLERPGEARRVEAAVEEVLADGVRTPDLAGPPGSEPVDTEAFTEAVLRRLEASRPAQVGK
jgi:3-isopropylmalate dehydrogenase